MANSGALKKPKSDLQVVHDVGKFAASAAVKIAITVAATVASRPTTR